MFRVITSRRRWVWIGIFLAVVFAFLAVVTYLPRLSFVVPTAGLTAAEQAKAQGDFRGHLLQAFAGLVLIVGAYFTAGTFALNREGQITERFTRAVEQLANDEQLDVRGSIHRRLTTFYEEVERVATGRRARRAATAYHRAAIQASNDRSNRILRGEILHEVLVTPAPQPEAPNAL